MLSVSALALVLAATSSVATGTHRAALIVGVNEPFVEAQVNLRYADDDAARYFELFSPEVDRVELLTVLDRESQPLFPDAAKEARSPGRPQLLDAIDRLEAASEEAHRAARKTELYFIYTGHGRVRGGEGEVRLMGDAIGRTELIERLLSSKSFDRIHLIVDACDAYHLVNARGENEGLSTAFDEAFERFVQGGTLERFPHVGAILSTNGPGVTHEWSRYRGGLFSHEVRSALAGAADADENGLIEYGEVGAFLAAANFEIPELKGRPTVFVRPPDVERKSPILSPRSASLLLELPASMEGHYVLEDDRGLRYAELHKAEGYAISLRLDPKRRYRIVSGDGGMFAELSAALRAKPPFSWIERSPSGTERGDDGPEGAFERAYDPSFAAGFISKIEDRAFLIEPPRSPLPKIAGLAAGSIAAIAIGGALWQSFEAKSSYDRYRQTFDASEKQLFQGEVEGARGRAVGLAIGAGVSAAAATLLLFLSD
jgi:hypothetical protein